MQALYKRSTCAEFIDLTLSVLLSVIMVWVFRLRHHLLLRLGTYTVVFSLLDYVYSLPLGGGALSCSKSWA